MSRNRFETRIREHGALKKPAGEQCACCDKPATHWVRVASSPMRGEDDHFVACQRHHDMAINPVSMGRFFAHMRSKERFVAGKREKLPGVQP